VQKENKNKKIRRASFFLRKNKNPAERFRRVDVLSIPRPRTYRRQHFVCFPAGRKRNNSRPTAGGTVHIPSATLC